nr:MAG TPA: DNA-directed RNA polymerase [Caudoviricetes sp.]
MVIKAVFSCPFCTRACRFVTIWRRSAVYWP